MAGLSQIAFLGGGGLSGLLAALLATNLGLNQTFAITGGVGLAFASWEIWKRGASTLEEQC